MVSLQPPSIPSLMGLAGTKAFLSSSDLPTHPCTLAPKYSPPPPIITLSFTLKIRESWISSCFFFWESVVISSWWRKAPFFYRRMPAKNYSKKDQIRIISILQILNDKLGTETKKWKVIGEEDIFKNIKVTPHRFCAGCKGKTMLLEQISGHH